MAGLDARRIRRLEESTSKLPPFLFRAFSAEHSAGLNNEHDMRPHASLDIPRPSIFGASYEEIAETLRMYRQCDDDDEEPSLFIPWSSSLLLVLHHAAYMNSFEEDFDVWIAVMDTRRICDMAMFPVTALMDVWNVRRDRNELEAGDLSSEYLFFGHLRNTKHGNYYKAVRLDKMYELDTGGCLSLFSRMSTGSRPSGEMIENHRRHLVFGPIGLYDGSMVIDIAALFGDEYQAVMAIALSTTSGGYNTPGADELANLLKEKSIQRPIDSSSLVHFNPLAVISQHLTEVHRMYQLLREVLEFPIGRQQAGAISASEPTENMALESGSQSVDRNQAEES